jgi:hypothetical protein
MNYYPVEESLQALLKAYVPLSAAQQARIGEIGMGVLLAGSSHLNELARWLKQATHQSSRVRWLQRTLEAPYLAQEYVYAPLVKQALAGYSAKYWHIVMDRSTLADRQTDLLSLNLAFRRRSIPLGWRCVAHGRTAALTQIALLEQCRPLLPADPTVIFHGDAEFDSIPLLRYLQQHHWEFIVGQTNTKTYSPHQANDWAPLATLPVTKTKAVYREAIDLTRTYQFGPVSLFAFYQPRFSLDKRKRKRDITYCVASLPITPALRRLGQRRWAIEPFFRDYKSSGWQLHTSTLTHAPRRDGLLTILALVYLWATCLGRWLSKSGQRSQVDAHAQRHLSLFRIGWDWLVHSYRTDQLCPALLTLYQ